MWLLRFISVPGVNKWLEWSVCALRLSISAVTICCMVIRQMLVILFTYEQSCMYWQEFKYFRPKWKLAMGYKVKTIICLEEQYQFVFQVFAYNVLFSNQKFMEYAPQSRLQFILSCFISDWDSGWYVQYIYYQTWRYIS